MRRLMTFAILAFFLGAFLFGFNIYAGKSVDWPGFAEGATSLAVIEGKITNIDLWEDTITLEGCELLGNEPLEFFFDYTTCYKGDENTDIVSIRGGTNFQKKDKLSFDQLKAGDYIKCNYTIAYGKVWAERIVLIASPLRVD
ncbi:MAG: hypothetical protein SCARUB_03381 [Candidatus Scalindua rubra]|uniref:DUF5666 domain-containing protein n=1 Tax=Candidatus Scalindua rubra TaxID=1872076 RepID=A0A1E3X7F0_9BACT|nr:MAG: hypothetical protein SCARUB_03381 [Candidatus Scalindua rubra]